MYSVRPLISFSLLLATSVANGATASLVDATATTVAVPAKAERIVTLMPSLGELVADLLGEDLSRMAGVAEQTDYPPRLAKITSVGPFHRFNLEKVLALRPDLVIASTDGNSKDQVLRLRELGLAVVVIGTSSFKEIGDSMRLAGKAIGEPDRGARMAAQFERGLESIRQRSRVKSRKPPRTLLQVGADPLVVAGHGTFLQEALEVAGGENAYGDSRTRYPRPAIEDVIRRSPDIIFILSMGPGEAGRLMARKAAMDWGTFPKIPAVAHNRVQVLSGDTGDALMRPTLRLLEGLSQLEKAVNQ